MRSYYSKNYRFRVGRYAGRTLEDLWNNGGIWGKSYVLWAYYHIPELDIEDKWLNEIGVEIVAKPGEYREVYEAMMSKHFTPEELEELKGHRNKAALGRYQRNAKITRGVNARLSSATRAYEARVSNKGSLAWKNQGH